MKDQDDAMAGIVHARQRYYPLSVGNIARYPAADFEAGDVAEDTHSTLFGTAAVSGHVKRSNYEDDPTTA